MTVHGSCQLVTVLRVKSKYQISSLKYTSLWCVPILGLVGDHTRGIPLITVTLSHGHTKIWNLMNTNFKTKIDNKIQKGICDIARNHEGKLNGDYFPYFSAKILFEIVPWT